MLRGDEMIICDKCKKGIEPKGEEGIMGYCFTDG